MVQGLSRTCSNQSPKKNRPPEPARNQVQRANQRLQHRDPPADRRRKRNTAATSSCAIQQQPLNEDLTTSSTSPSAKTRRHLFSQPRRATKKQTASTL